MSPWEDALPGGGSEMTAERRSAFCSLPAQPPAWNGSCSMSSPGKSCRPPAPEPRQGCASVLPGVRPSLALLAPPLLPFG